MRASLAENPNPYARSRRMKGGGRARTCLRYRLLYRALSAQGNPTLRTTVEVLQALGLRLSVARIH
jgi:DNA-binding phage protein